MRLPTALLYFLLLISAPAFAGDTTVIVQRHNSWQYLKVTFEDDYFNIAGRGSDKYYTGGWQIDAFYKHNSNTTPLTDRLLLKLPGANELYFYGISRRIYTPDNMQSPYIVYGDHPYASVLTIQHGLVAVNPAANESLVSEVGIGAIGPMTYGGEIQKWFHRMIGDEIPQGWHNQVHNDIIVDYRANYEKQVLHPATNLRLLVNIDCEVGTLADNMGVGMTLNLGKPGKAFIRDNLQIPGSDDNPGKLRIHMYMHPTVRVVVYNASLEGGFFSKSPYLIKYNDINYYYLQYDMGIVLTYKRIGMSFTEKTRTAEFRTGQVQQIGSVSIWVPL